MPNRHETRGRPKDMSPVTRKIRKMVDDWTNGITLEKIAVAADIKYNTLRNIFVRETISYNTLAGLRYAGIITEKEEKEHYEWVKKRQERKRSLSKTSKTQSKTSKKAQNVG